MARLSSSQIEKVLHSLVYFTITSGAANNTNVTTALTTRLNTAGDGGVSVPVQAATTDIGVVTGTGNACKVFQSNGEALYDGNGNRVYARITFASTVYTVSYFVLINGTETAYTFTNSTNLLIGVPYAFDLFRYPRDAVTNTPVEDTIQIGGTVPEKVFSERLNVTSLNTISNLTKNPTNNALVKLIINGQVQTTYDNSFAVSSRAIAWSSTNARFDVRTTDLVVAEYSTLD